MSQGKFIVIEGLEGAGKSSAVAYVEEWLRQHGIQAIEKTREPGGTPLAERMRALVKEVHDEPLTMQAELLLMYAARVQLVENRIKPAMAPAIGSLAIAMISPRKPIRAEGAASLRASSARSNRRCSGILPRI